MFVTQGPIDPESNMFAGRAAELRRMETWLPSTHCVGAVLGARQTGKTSLLLKLRHAMRSKYAFVFVDFEAVAQAKLAECLNYIAGEMIDQLAGRIGGFERPVLKDQGDFLAFLEKAARAAHDLRIVLLLDEIGALLPDAAFKLSSAIRAIFTTRHVKPEFARYVFVLAGATDMLDLTKGRSSPLKNVADSLYLGDLSVAETEQLVAEVLGDALTPGLRKTFQSLHAWTAGHPYWTQLLGEALGRAATELPEAAITVAVEQLLQTEDRNLPHVFRALDADGGLWDLVGALLAGAPISFTRSNHSIAKLELIGLLKNDNGRCRIRNRIYREALEQHPIRRPRVPGRDLHSVTQRLLAAADLETLLHAVATNLQATLQNRSVTTVMKHAANGSFSIASSVGVAGNTELTFDAGSALAKLGANPIETQKAGLSEREIDLLERFGVTLIVPIRLESETVAFIWLGRKLSGDAYDDADLEFLTAVAEQVTDGFDRMRLRGLERDVHKAWEIQRGLLPQELPQVEGVMIDGSCQPARVVGGNYYDALQLGQQTLAFCIGDVVGKGLPAALLMANLQASVRTSVSDAVSPSRVCENINRLLARNIRPGEFITFFYALFDGRTRKLVCTNAGHNYPLLFRKDGDVVRLNEGGPPLGIFPDCRYGQQELVLASGDRLLLFTDGVTESCNASGEELGEDRLIALGRRQGDATTLHRSVVETVRTFRAGVLQDDVTVLALSVL
jgi:hypothetical protein